MRTTIDLPDDLHRTASQIARDRRQTLSRTVVDLVRAGMTARPASGPVEIDPETGFGLVRVGHPITAEDVAEADDE